MYLSMIGYNKDCHSPVRSLFLCYLHFSAIFLVFQCGFYQILRYLCIENQANLNLG